MFLSYFKLTKNEIKSSIVFSIILLIIITIKLNWATNSKLPTAQLQKITYSQKSKKNKYNLKNKNFKKHISNSNYNSNNSKKTLSDISQKININQLNLNDLEKVNFDTKKAQLIINFRAKIGGFNQWYQLEKVFDLQPNELEWFKKNTFIEQKTIQINHASTKEWIELKGIGEKLAERIVKYRTKIGGFYSINQLKEVYGLSTETFESIKNQLSIQNNEIQKKSLALCDFETLQKLPYLNQYNAKLIIQKRSNGELKSLEDLQKFIPDSIYQKVKNYVYW